MKAVQTELEGVLLIEPDVFRDTRGFFLESYNRSKYRQLGIDADFVQDNHSRSSRNTVRGLHAQRLHPQAKLVRVIEGSIFDVVVDIRRGSPNYARWIGMRLSADNFMQCYIPPGYAHGFCVLSEVAQIEYKCTDFYYPDDELHILWADPDIGVTWPVVNPMLSDKDRAGRRLRDLIDLLPIIK
ncbi:MAG: dTDP-4-dehydrorhamnose 3,5-epimerase [Deltaproteobacteria bacterium]|nr:dTDP-4-dehydrorhamnose 3,5-epimerase [Deltaproteobacteria bacterium]